MAFLENPFALLNDTDGDDAELFVPIAVKADKNPGNKKNTNQQKPQSSVAPDKSRMARVPPHIGRSGNGRGEMGRGSANGNGFHRLDNRQNGAPQSNGGRYNGQDDVNKQYGGSGYGYRQNRQGNGYHKVNRQSNTHEQNTDGGYKHYRRGSDSAGYEANANKQQEWHGRGADRSEFHKINGSGNEDQILVPNQQVKSQGEEKLADGDSFEGEVPQLRNGKGGWNFVGDRRGSRGRGGPPGNRSWGNQFSSRFGEVNREKGEASVPKPKESLNGEPRESEDKSVTIEGEEITEVSNNAEPRQINHEGITKRNQSEELIKEDKKVHARNMTLEEYEKQLIEKRKALEALKPQERKVTRDKDFELMQLVGRNKEDFATKLNSEKQNLEEEESIEKVRLKKGERPEQRERVRRSMSMDVFLKVFKSSSDRIGEGRVGYGRDFERDGRGRGGEHDEERAGYSGGYSRNVVEAAPNAGKTITPSKAREINIQDSEHFPGLSAVAKS